ncbi:hypothetical protein IAR50_000139 [Cryptococcus sp. DSM 104548]
MTTRPRTSYMVHSGFNDLISLISATPSRLGVATNGVNGDPKRDSRWSPARDSGLPRKSFERPVAPVDGVAGIGYTEEELSKPPVPPNNADQREIPGLQSPRSPQSSKPPTPPAKELPQSKELKKRKVDKREIGYPTDFRHIFHASTYEEANELLLRWSAEGLSDKIGDPAWANPIKQIVKTRALEQQARAVAAVVEATARTRELGNAAHDLAPPGTLRVINGLPSSIYSSLNSNPLLNNPTPSSLDTAHVKPEPTTTTISPSLARASTPRMIANMAGSFEYESSRSSPGSALGQPGTSPESPIKFTNKKSLPLNMAPTLEPMAEHPDPSELPPGLLIPPSNLKKRDQRPSAQDLFTPLPFRVIKPTLPTLEKAMSVALFFEGYYHPFLTPNNGLNPYDLSSPGSHDKLLSSPIHPSNYPLLRARRQAVLENTLLSPENRFMSPAQQDLVRADLQAEERRWLRERRRKVDVRAFEMGRVIGHGAFGVVRIAREREGGRLVAMKQLRKADMLQKSQEGHVKAEKDLLASASSSHPPPLANLPASSAPAPSRIVQLFYAFQDTDHLYLVLEYMGGGDLLNLLVERDTFSEDMTRVYVAEMVLALEETHGLGYVHRDIKPDNFLFDKEGHIKISDFGLATDLHWAHDTSYYEQQRLALLKKHGVDLEYPSVKTKRMDRKDVKRILGKEWVEKGEGVLEWRERNRRKLAYSVCGTNSYMAPEVIRGQGYGFSCDWWSLGIIMYECLYGYPPFTSSSRHVTRQKILNWPQTLKFPPTPKFSASCLDLITRLLCEPEDRLGSSSSADALSGASSPAVGVDGAGRATAGRPRGKRVLSAGSGLGLGQEEKGGLGKDGVEEIKRHPWFKNIDWENLHRQTPPYSPNLYTDDDTRHFDEDIPSEPLAPPGTAQDSKDPLLRNKTHGAHLLEIRKQLAFKGWTFKSPHLDSPSPSSEASKETRYGHLDWVARGGAGGGVEHLQDASDETVMPGVGRHLYAGAGEGEEDDGELRGTVKARAMSY